MSAADCNPHRDVIDEREGTRVCTLCGLVLDSTIFLDTTTPTSYPAEPSHYESGNSKFAEYIRDVCSNNHIPRVVADDAIQQFRRQAHPGMSKSESMAAYAIYDTLIRHKTPRALSEIQFCTDVSAKKLWKLEAREECRIVLTKPSDFMPRIEVPLGLTHKESRAICQEADALQNSIHAAPQSLLATVVYLRMRRSSTRQCTRTLKDISEMCRVSVSCIKRTRTKIEQLHPPGRQTAGAAPAPVAKSNNSASSRSSSSSSSRPSPPKRSKSAAAAASPPLAPAAPRPAGGHLLRRPSACDGGGSASIGIGSSLAAGALACGSRRQQQRWTRCQLPTAAAAAATAR
ncbi:unnamed protein product [Sphagnum tenellum]